MPLQLMAELRWDVLGGRADVRNSSGDARNSKLTLITGDARNSKLTLITGDARSITGTAKSSKPILLAGDAWNIIGATRNSSGAAKSSKLTLSAGDARNIIGAARSSKPALPADDGRANWPNSIKGDTDPRVAGAACWRHGGSDHHRGGMERGGMGRMCLLHNYHCVASIV